MKRVTVMPPTTTIARGCAVWPPIFVDSAAGNTLYYEVTGSFPSTFPTTSPPAESIPNTVHINFYVVGQD